MYLIQALYDQIEELRNDYINGSSAIALHALDIVTAAIDLNVDPSMAFPKDIAQKLKQTKPSMSAIDTVVDYAMHDYSKSVGKVKKYFCDKVRERFINCTLDSVQICFDDLFGKSKKKKTIVTCSYSNNVIGVLFKAHEAGIELDVYTVESVWRDRDYADVLGSVLHRNNIEPKKISVDDIHKLPEQPNFILIGCDGYDDAGNALNGAPSQKLAKTVYNKIPLYVVGESFKHTPKLHPSDGFELISSKYIKKIFSDNETWR
jgi:translation initiation factor 2B subunit (eIF-2B alpha/beta/delta family)